MLRCSMGSFIFAWVRLGGGVEVGVGAPVAAKMSASCWMAYMVWATKRVKGAASVRFARASARRLATSMATLTEEISGMATLWGKTVLFW